MCSSQNNRCGVLEDVHDLEGQVLGLGLKVSSPRKLLCPRPRTALFLESLHFCWKTSETSRKICEDLFFRDRLKKIFEDLLFGKHLHLSPWPWPRAFLFSAWRGSVLGRAVLVLGFGFFCGTGLGLEPCVLESTSAKQFKQISHN